MRKNLVFKGWHLFVCVSLLFVAAACFAPPAYAQDSVCAGVKMDISQKLTFERQAFDAHMQITNGLTNIAVEDVDVNVHVEDDAGNPVTITTDPYNTTATFFIRVDSLTGIGAIDGTGTVTPETVADIHWLLIPAQGASNGDASGTGYHVGATLTYTMAAEPFNIEVLPDRILVKPMPGLVIDYFLPRDVWSDDAFTPEIEPPIPFSFGLRVKNDGPGDATGVKIESAQPHIENDQGLLIGFLIEGTEINGQPTADTLLADIGDIDANNSGTVRWVMTTSLSGEFINFSATYKHADDLGGEVTSLIDSLVTHTLVGDVLVDLPGRDGIRDFLADDLDGYRVYESNSVETDVTDLSAGANLALFDTNGTEVTYTLTTTVAVGLSYATLADPHDGLKEVVAVVRSDGKIIEAANVWLSKRRNDVSQLWEYSFHLFDSDTTGSYGVVFDDPPAGPQAPVLQFIADGSVVEGNQISFIVTASDPDGTTPALSAAPLPSGATLIDQGDGTAVFDWQTAVGQAGAYDITFTASDGTLTDTQQVKITVNPTWDTDGDLMADAWEVTHFGDILRDGTGDYDGDGSSDLDEYLAGTDPASSLAPSAPVVFSPVDGSETTVLQPVLTAANSTDPDGGTTTYEFEIYEDEGMTLPAAAAAGVAEGAGTTAWTVASPLVDDNPYWWRVRATDGKRYSAWTYAGLFVNTANNAPAGVASSHPADGTTVDSLTPTLEVTNGSDSDGDALVYDFEVYEDAGLTLLAASAAGIVEGQGGSTSWTVNEILSNGTTYWWNAKVTDEHGLSMLSATGTFVVDTANGSPSAPVVSAPADGGETASLSPTLTVANAVDPESAPLSYLFEIDEAPTFDSPALQQSGAVAEGAGTTSWAVPAALGNDTGYYWRAKASDGAADGPWTNAGFFVSTANDAPDVPTHRNPSAEGETWSLTPLLLVLPATDADGDALTYDYEIYDETFTTLHDAATLQGESWRVTTALTHDTHYTWRARAVDEHGVPGGWSATMPFYLHTGAWNVPPSVRILRPAAGGEATNAASYDIAWVDADEESDATVSLSYDDDAAGFDGTLITAGISEDDPADAHAWNISALGEGSYYVYATIADEASQEQAYAAGPLVIDRTPPAVAAAPPGGIYGAPQSVTLTADETATIYYTDDGSAPTTAATVYTAPVGVDVTATLRFFAVDIAGNAGSEASESYVIDGVAPTGTVLINGDAAETALLDVTLDLAASDGEGQVVEMRFGDDGVIWGAWEPYGTIRSWSLASGDGQKWVYAQFRDDAGNESAAASDDIVLDQTAPTVTITSPAPGPTGDSTPLLEYAVSDGTVTVLVDAAAVSKVSGDSLDPLADGGHVVRVEATDTLGQTGFDEVSFTVDSAGPSGPSVVILSPAWGPTGDTTPLLLYSVSEGTVSVFVDDVPVSTLSGEELDVLADGRHTLRVESLDGLGHLGSAEVIFDVRGCAVVWTANPGVVAGDVHSLALAGDGGLWAWGDNADGQLGDGTSQPSNLPVQVGAGQSWDFASSGTLHNAATQDDGSLWTWGDNTFGQLGDGTTQMRTAPVQVGALYAWIFSAAGDAHSVAIADDGSLWAWGDNGAGQLGDGTTAPSYDPLRIGVATDWTAVDAGLQHTVALKNDGSLWAWGDNGAGQLGDGTTTPRQIPAQVGTDVEWTAVAAGDAFTVALKSDGSLWAWGEGAAGQLGDGTGAGQLLPVQVGADFDWVSVAAAGVHALAVKTDGTLWTWGDHGYDATGDSIADTSLVPVRVGTDSDWIKVAAGALHSIALAGDGSLWAWGEGSAGQLGDGTNLPSVTPVQVLNIDVMNCPPLPTAPAIVVEKNVDGTSQIDPGDPDAGDGHSYAIVRDPLNGTASVDLAGLVSYSPDKKYTGTDDLDVLVTDTWGASGNLTVTAYVGVDPPCTDVDTDTYAIEGGACGPVDCDDADPLVNPGAAEICDDTIDNDCDTLIDDLDILDCFTCTDVDNDTYAIEGGSCGEVDCDDSDPLVNPGAAEICDDTIDNDCDGLIDTPEDPDCATCTDADNDTYAIEGGSCGEVDCDDAAPLVNPGAAEICDDTIDNDCDTLIDDLDILDCMITICADYTDKSTCQADPSCEWIGSPKNGSCQDAVPPTCTDVDGDTYAIEGGSCGEVDCDDADPLVNPGAAEICDDTIDNDCDTLIDTPEDPDCATCTDADGDTYAIEGGACGEVDCDDADPLVNPGAAEICDDTIDNDCDTLIDTPEDPDCAPPACNGNGTCDPGEDCELCPDECDGVLGGKPANRYCCGNGTAEGPEGDGTICDGNY